MKFFKEFLRTFSRVTRSPFKSEPFPEIQRLRTFERDPSIRESFLSDLEKMSVAGQIEADFPRVKDSFPFRKGEAAGALQTPEKFHGIEHARTEFPSRRQNGVSGGTDPERHFRGNFGEGRENSRSGRSHDS
ncbi:hypothetical protein SDC9_212553 [bioreactor metagenome]|uniref:Uncharacterized protein n=1 Tax=bioreactor metagenome TaxID=1076179 RepID=A0A645JN10_9ZZZZ